MVWGLFETFLHICMAASDKHMVSMTEDKVAVANFYSFPASFHQNASSELCSSQFDSKPWFRDNRFAPDFRTESKSCKCQLRVSTGSQ
jgi:hypothetical protein